MFQVEEEPEYEEPPLLPPRPADLIEEEEEEKQTYAECEPAPVPQEEDYEDIDSYATAGLTHTLGLFEMNYTSLPPAGESSRLILSNCSAWPRWLVSFCSRGTLMAHVI